MTKETEVLERLDRIIDMLENMNSEESKHIKSELENLHKWRIRVEAAQTTKSGMLEKIRWFGPWIVALAFVIFEHKFKIL